MPTGQQPLAIVDTGKSSQGPIGGALNVFNWILIQIIAAVHRIRIPFAYLFAPSSTPSSSSSSAYPLARIDCNGEAINS